MVRDLRVVVKNGGMIHDGTRAPQGLAWWTNTKARSLSPASTIFNDRSSISEVLFATHPSCYRWRGDVESLGAALSVQTQ
jgi:hypothetical protein